MATGPIEPIGGATLTTTEVTDDCGCCGGSGSGGTVQTECCPNPIGRRLMLEVTGCNDPVWYFEYVGLFIEVLGVPTQVLVVPAGYTGSSWHEWKWADGNCLSVQSLCPGEYPSTNHVPEFLRCYSTYSAGVVTFTSWSDSSTGMISCDSTTDATLVSEQCDPFLLVYTYGSNFSCACLTLPGVTITITEA